jgi:phosphoribosylformylglycinamidine synthase
VSPDLKLPGEGRLLYIELGGGRHRLGGSALAQVFGQIGDEAPDLEDPALFKRAFEVVQDLIADEKISAGHDVSDGGLVTTLLEMAFAGKCGLNIELEDPDDDHIAVLFAEELGWVIEIRPDDEAHVIDCFKKAQVPCVTIGSVETDPTVKFQFNGRVVLEDDTRDLRDLWEATSFELDRLQANPECVDEERKGLHDRTGPKLKLTYEPKVTSPAILNSEDKHRVAILREEGSNGDREMASAFYAAGFEPWDVVMSDLLTGRMTLEGFRGVVAVGGFSYADVLDAAKGWAGVIRFNKGLREQFQAFYERPDTFSLGVCNGCQLLAVLGWVPWSGLPDVEQPRFIQNASGRFESRFTAVTIEKSPAVMFEGMEGSTLGIWVAHGEGRAYFPEPAILEKVESQGLAPLRFVDDDGQVTESYPFNPNGSPHGIAGLCTPDGRHLVVMPHPERSFTKWQWGFMPEDWKRDLEACPWLRMFQNARSWCDRNP